MELISFSKMDAIHLVYLSSRKDLTVPRCIYVPHLITLTGSLPQGFVRCLALTQSLNLSVLKEERSDNVQDRGSPGMVDGTSLIFCVFEGMPRIQFKPFPFRCFSAEHVAAVYINPVYSVSLLVFHYESLFC